MGLLFYEKRVSTSNNSRDLQIERCPDDREGRDQVIGRLNRQGHRVLSYYVTEEDVEEVELQNVRSAPARPRRSR